jgi:hypothetical protein
MQNEINYKLAGGPPACVPAPHLQCRSNRDLTLCWHQQVWHNLTLSCSLNHHSADYGMTASVDIARADTTSARRRLHAAGVLVTYTIPVRLSEVQWHSGVNRFELLSLT